MLCHDNFVDIIHVYSSDRGPIIGHVFYPYQGRIQTIFVREGHLESRQFAVEFFTFCKGGGL